MYMNCESHSTIVLSTPMQARDLTMFLKFVALRPLPVLATEIADACRC